MSRKEMEQRLQMSRRLFLQRALVVSATAAGALGAGPLLDTVRGTSARAVVAAQGGGLGTNALGVLGFPRNWQRGEDLTKGVYNTYSGNVLYQHTVLADDAVGLQLFFNSRAATNSGPLGAGWTHTYRMRIDSTSVPGYVLFIDKDGGVIPFTVSGSTYTAPAGAERTLIRNADLTWRINRTGSSRYYHFLSDGKLDSVRDSQNGQVIIQLTYTSGNLTEVQNGFATLTFAYSGSTLSSVTDYQGRTWSFSYSNGKLAQISEPALGGQTYSTGFTYDANGQITAVSDIGSAVWNFTFTSAGFLQSATAPGTGTTNYNSVQVSPSAPSGPGMQLPGQIEPMPDDWPSDVVAAGSSSGSGGSVYYGYDSGGRMTAQQGATVERAVYSYDGQNRILGIELESGASWAYTYDSNGNVTSETVPSGAMATYQYNANSKITGVTGATGNTLSHTYDAQGRLTGISTGGGSSAAITYNANGQPTLLQNSVTGATVEYEYDDWGNAIRIKNQLGANAYFTHGTDNLLTQETDARGRVIQYQYDSWKRLTRLLFPTSGRADQVTTYDTKNRVTAASNAAGSWTYGFNTAGNRTSVSGPYGVASASYDSGGYVQWTQDDTTRRHTYTYDSQKRVTAIAINDGTGTISIVYGTNGLIQSETFPNGTRVNYSYDTHDRLVGLSHTKVSNGQVLASFTRVLDSATGRLNRITEQPSGAATDFTYGTDGKLLVEESKIGTTQVYKSLYTYNVDGHILTAQRWEAGVLSHNGVYTYNTAGLLTGVTDSVTGLSEVYTWYQDMTLASFSGPGYTRLLEYDEMGRLVRISRNTGGTITVAYEYAYSPEGYLVLRKDYIAGTQTAYVHGLGYLDGRIVVVKQRPIAGGSWTVVSKPIHSVGGTVGAGGVFYHDSLSNGPVLVTNASAAVAGSATVDLFGLIRGASGSLVGAPLPGTVVNDGVTITLANGRAAIAARHLKVA